MNRRRLPGLIAFFALLAILSMNVLALNATRFVPQGPYTDYGTFSWNYWWIRHALTSGQSFYSTNYVLQPIGEVNLGINTFTPIWFPIWAVVEPLVNSNLAINVVLWVGLILAGTWMALFIKEETGSSAIGLLAGAFLMTQPYLSASVEFAHVNMMGVFFYPLTIMVWKRVAATLQLRWALVMGGVFWLAWLTDSMWLMFLPFTIVPYGLMTLYRAGSQKIRLHLVGLGLVTIAVFAALSWFLLPWQAVAGFDYSAVSSADREAARRWAVDPQTLFMLPTALDIAEGRHIGRVIPLLVIASLFVRGGKRERWFWLATAIPFMLLSMPPDITIGETRINLPYWYYHQAFDGMFRTPQRFLPGYFFCILVFISMTWAPRFRGWAWKPRLAVVIALFLIVSADLQVFQIIRAAPPVTPYSFYEMMAAEEDDYVVMEVPVAMASGWTTTGRNFFVQYNGIIHGKRMVNATLTRVPDWYHYFFEHEAVLGWLGGFHPFREEIIETFRGYVEDLPIGYIVVNQDKMFPGQAEDILGHFNEMDFLCPVLIEGPAVLYGTNSHSERCVSHRPPAAESGVYELDFGVPGDEFHIGLGFHRQELIGGPSGRWLGAGNRTETLVFLELPPGSAYTMTLEATAFNQPRSLSLFIEDTPIAEFEVSDQGYGQYSAQIPAVLLGEAGEFTLRLVYGTPVSAAELGASGDERPISIALNWIRFEPAAGSSN